MDWKLLPAISAPMSLQMMLDESLFDCCKQNSRSGPLLRFYYSSDPWITTGYSFCGREDRNRSELIRMNPDVPVTRRITGGGCVFHGKDLIFSLIAKYETAPSRPPGQGKGTEALASVKASYQKIHEAVRLALKSSGIDPRFYEEHEKLPKGKDCFECPVAKDLSWNGKKIAGGAQKRSEGVLLHHESIRIPEGINGGELIRGIKKGFEEAFGVRIGDADLDPEIYFKAAKQQNL